MNTLRFRTPRDENENRKLRKEYTRRLSQNLKELRKTQKITQQELAEKAG